MTNHQRCHGNGSGGGLHITASGGDTCGVDNDVGCSGDGGEDNHDDSSGNGSRVSVTMVMVVVLPIMTRVVATVIVVIWW